VHGHRSKDRQEGYSLLEIIFVCAIVSVVMVGASIVMPTFLKQSKADAATALAMNALRLARDRAIGERRNLEVVLTTPNRITVVRDGISGESNATVTDVYLENGQQFTVFSGLPDTPDGFSLTNAPLAFGPTQGTQPTIMFTSEGTLIDGSGDPINGTVFLGRQGDRTSARAITIFGPTAAFRTWRWDGTKWVESA
jgi:type II secretory pathway pseudopilin PulG